MAVEQALGLKPQEVRGCERYLAHCRHRLILFARQLYCRRSLRTASERVPFQPSRRNG